MHGRPLTLEDHQRSRMIADPYHLFDCCQESDGACAVVVTTTDRARDLRQTPVLIAGAAEGLAAGDGGDRFRRPRELWTSAGLGGVARDLYARAGVGPDDIDVAQLYENFTGQVLMTLEDFGFCAKGEGGPFDTDVPLQVTLLGRQRSRRIEATLGDGGPLIRALTTNGPVVIRKR